MRYTSRGIRRRGDSSQWEVILSHKDPFTGEMIPTYHTITAKTKKAAEKASGKLIVDMEIKGGTVSSSITVQQFMGSFLAYKESSGTIEPSTIRGYRAESRQIPNAAGTSSVVATACLALPKESTSMPPDSWCAPWMKGSRDRCDSFRVLRLCI